MLAAALFTLLSTAPPAPAPVVLVLPVAGDADARARDAADGELRAAVDALGSVSVLPRKAADDVVAAARALGLPCSVASAACALQLGGLAGADLVLQASRAATGAMSARLLDVAGQRERRRASLPAYRDLRDARLLAVRLLAPERERGRILVRAQPEGCTILVDGVARANGARVVVAPDVEHDVYVAKPGFASFEQKVTVGFDADAVIDVKLLPDDTMKAAAIPFALREPAGTLGDDGKRLFRVAMYEIKDPDAPPRVPRIVTEALLVELRKLDGVTVIGLDEIRTMLDFEAKKQAAGCADDGCLAEIADALGADAILLPAIAHAGAGTTVFGARRIDPKLGQVTAQVRKDFRDAGGEEYIASVGDVVKELFPDFALKPGEHRGADPALALRVNPPPLSPWVFWSTVGASGALAAGTAVTGVVNLAAANRFAGVNTGQEGADVVANDDLTFGTGVAFWAGVGLTATTAAGAAVAALFTDWWGYGSDTDADADTDTAQAASAGAAR